MVWVLYALLVLIGLGGRAFFRLQILATIDAGKYAGALDEDFTKQLAVRKQSIKFWFNFCLVIYVAMVAVTGLYSLVYFNLFDVLGLLQ